MERKSLEKYVTKAMEKEKELETLKSHFMTLISHKLRTPLSTILSSVFMLENYNGPDYEMEKKVYIEKIKRAVGNLTKLLDDAAALGQVDEVNTKDSEFKIFFEEFLKEINDSKRSKIKPGSRIPISKL